jgi:hypothetical protein
MGTDVILEAGDVITLRDLRDGKVRFVHSSPDVKDSKSIFYIMPFNSFRTSVIANSIISTIYADL